MASPGVTLVDAVSPHPRSNRTKSSASSGPVGSAPGDELSRRASGEAGGWGGDCTKEEPESGVHPLLGVDLVPCDDILPANADERGVDPAGVGAGGSFRKTGSRLRASDPSPWDDEDTSTTATPSITGDIAAIIDSFQSGTHEPVWGVNLDGTVRRSTSMNAGKALILTAELQEMDEEAETLASRTAALAQKMLRRVVAWLNGLDSTSLEQDLDALSKRLSMAETRALTINTGGLVIGVLSVFAALFTGAMYLLLRTWSGCYIPFAYAIFMSGMLLVLRILNRRKSKNRGLVFQIYLVTLAVLVTLLPAAVHVSVGGIDAGCANGVFGWSILGPLVMISVGTSAHLRRAMEVISGASRGGSHRSHRWAAQSSGQGFYVGLVGRTMTFALVLYFDIEPVTDCASELPAAARVTMFLFHQMACPLLIVIVYLQLVSWLRDRSQILARLEGVARQRLDRSKQLTLSLVPDFASERLNRVAPNQWHRVDPLYYEDCTLIQMDVMGFSDIVSKLEVTELVDVLNGLFSSIDFAAKCIGKVWKVETIGDCYIGVIGGPQPCEDHADRAILLAASILDIVAAMSHRMPFPLKVRIAVHSGKLKASVMGRLLPRYLVFGRDMEIVNCLEPLATDHEIRVSSTTRALSKWEWEFLKEQDRIEVGDDETVEATLLAPTSEDNIDVLTFNRKLYPFLSQFHILVAKSIGGSQVRLGAWKRIPNAASASNVLAPGTQGHAPEQSSVRRTLPAAPPPLVNGTRREGSVEQVHPASKSPSVHSSHLDIPEAAAWRGPASSVSVDEGRDKLSKASLQMFDATSQQTAPWRRQNDIIGAALSEKSESCQVTREHSREFPASDHSGHSGDDSHDSSQVARATADIMLQVSPPMGTVKPSHSRWQRLPALVPTSNDGSNIVPGSSEPNSDGTSDGQNGPFGQPFFARKFLQAPLFKASWLGSKPRSVDGISRGESQVSRPTAGSFSSKNSDMESANPLAFKQSFTSARTSLVRATQILYLVSVAICAATTAALNIWVALAESAKERGSGDDEHARAALNAACAMRNMTGDTSSCTLVDGSLSADLQVALYGVDGFYGSEYYRLCCSRETLLGIGVSGAIFAFVALCVAFCPSSIDEISGNPTWVYHVQRIATVVLLALAPVFTSGGLLGEQSTGASHWPFLAVIYLTISGLRMRVVGSAFFGFFVIALVMHLLRAFLVGFAPLRLWWTLVLYAMNELVPSTLIVMPIFWFQQKIISEERSSSLAQAQVHKLQRRQDELLDALLPPAIVEHMRKGEGVLFNSAKDAAVIFVYVTQTKKHALNGDAAALIQWLGAVYAAFDDVLRLEFNSSVIKIETQHDHFLAVCGILDPRDDAANVCVKAAVRMGRAIAGIMQPDGQPTVVKLGVAAGPLSGGVIGLEVPRFSVFGPPVVCAARMAMTAQESCSGSSVVHISDRAAKNLTRSFLEDDCIVEGLTCGKRGKGMQIKGLGFQQTWEVRETDSRSLDETSRVLAAGRRSSVTFAEGTTGGKGDSDGGVEGAGGECENDIGTAGGGGALYVDVENGDDEPEYGVA